MSRAGSRALLIFTHVLNPRVLRAHAEGGLRPNELEEKLGWAPQSTLRASVGNLIELGILARDDSPRSATELTEAGRGLLFVADTLELWLGQGPSGAIELEDAAARGTIRALAAAWDSAMVRALAERQMTLAEINDLMKSISYPAVKRRLAKLRSTQLVVRVGSGRDTTYEASEWLRRAIAPLAVAGRWEREHDLDAKPVSPVEVEAAFLLTLPLVDLPDNVSGTCSLAVLIADGDGKPQRQVAGVTLELQKGRVASCLPKGARNPSTWALGTTDAWMEAVLEGRPDALRIQGVKPDLPRRIVKSIHKELLDA